MSSEAWIGVWPRIACVASCLFLGCSEDVPSNTGSGSDEQGSSSDEQDSSDDGTLGPCVLEAGNAPCGTACSECDNDEVGCACDGEGSCTHNTTYLCGSPLQQPGAIDSLVARWGCGDVLLYAADGGRRLMIRVEAEGALAQLRIANPAEIMIDLSQPDAAASVVALTGDRLDGDVCEGISPPAPQIGETWLGTTGTVVLTLSEVGGAVTASATIADVEFEFDGSVVTVPLLDWQDIVVGD